jgi:hypothetical protein
MTVVSQGLYKTLAYKKQSGLGSPATGAGGTYLRRETATFEKTKDTYNNNEIVSHQQYTGDTYGVSKTTGDLSDVLSPGSFAPFMGSLNRNTFTSGVSSTGLSLTIAGAGPFTLTRAAGSFLTDGIKAGDVVRITAGTFTGIASNLNLIVLSMTATVLTVMVPNGKVLSAQGPVASATIAVVNKKSVTPSTGQANDYYTIEEFFSDLSPTVSRLWTDTQVGAVDISIPATGNATVKFTFLGLARTKNSTQQLTSPNPASTTTILTAANAAIFINASQTLVATSLAIKIDGQLAAGEAVIGSKSISDNVRGDLKISGTVTVLKQDETFSNLFDNETPVPILGILFADTTDTSDFIGFSVPRAKLFSDQVDDGKKQIVQTSNFTAEYNGTNGGAAAAYDQGTISIQDSAA